MAVGGQGRVVIVGVWAYGSLTAVCAILDNHFPLAYSRCCIAVGALFPVLLLSASSPLSPLSIPSQDTGANDYLHLCAAFHTLLLGNVPRLTMATKDAARRFIVLIDTLYDRKVPWA